jgi:hypothetical protein
LVVSATVCISLEVIVAQPGKTRNAVTSTADAETLLM